MFVTFAMTVCINGSKERRHVKIYQLLHYQAQRTTAHAMTFYSEMKKSGVLYLNDHFFLNLFVNPYDSRARMSCRQQSNYCPVYQQLEEIIYNETQLQLLPDNDFMWPSRVVLVCLCAVGSSFVKLMLSTNYRRFFPLYYTCNIPFWPGRSSSSSSSRKETIFDHFRLKMSDYSSLLACLLSFRQ